MSDKTRFQVAPVPTAIDVVQVSDGRGGQLVMMRFSTPVGVACYFLLPANAKDIAAQLAQLGALESIVVPGGAP